jgi:hypothetical protein
VTLVRRGLQELLAQPVKLDPQGTLATRETKEKLALPGPLVRKERKAYQDRTAQVTVTQGHRVPPVQLARRERLALPVRMAVFRYR